MPFNFVPELNQTEREVSELKSEANAAISFIQEYWNPEDPESPAKTAAIIMPVNKDIQLIAQALEKAGIEYQINSEGALLSLPEIQDILCLLRLSVKADDESSITRLLTGSFLEFSPYLINKLSRILKNVNANRRTEFEKNFENESSELEYIPISLFEILEDFEYKKVLEKELKRRGFE